jgi:hypothetical protein
MTWLDASAYVFDRALPVDDQTLYMESAAVGQVDQLARDSVTLPIQAHRPPQEPKLPVLVTDRPAASTPLHLKPIPDFHPSHAR